MGTVRAFDKELLVIGILMGMDVESREYIQGIESSFGPISILTEAVGFDWTTYYDKEMGEGIRRCYALLERPVDPSTLANIKSTTNAIERDCSLEGKRRINLDPGLLAPGRFVLATTKDRAHRIPLAEGIFAELTLIYEKASFRALPWTYPDWASEEVRSMLKTWRNRLLHRQN
jgi:hypothetical protein